MSTDIVTEDITETLPEPEAADVAAPAPDSEGASGASDAPSDPIEDEPETYSAEYVRGLRDESAKHRVKAKRVDDANARLVAAYAASDGRLQNVEDVPMSEDLLDSEGLVDRDKVIASIDALVAAKPYLQARRAPSLPMGPRSDANPEVGWVDILRGAVR